jgi:hypothetical protein
MTGLSEARDEEISARWQQVSIEIGHQIRCMVNTPAMIGGKDETGYVLMFFNVKNHNGKSTLVSSATDKNELRKLLQCALDNLNSPKAQLIEPEKPN